MAKQLKIFYAHPYQPPSITETISKAILKIKGSNVAKQKNIEIKPWTDNRISGTSLITSVLKQIDRHNVFACDLTYQNNNVNFELGYAVAKYKRVFTSLNSSIEDADRTYRRIHFPLLGMAYATYENHESLADALLEEKPWDSLDQTLLDKRYRQPMPRPEHPTVMYIMPPLNSDSVIAVQEEFRNSIFRDSIIVDNPNEYSSQTLDWYAEKLLTADSVVIHFLSTEHTGYAAHNYKASIVAGLAHGFGRPLIMLAHNPYLSPLDYEKWLSVHDTAEACVSITRKWLDDFRPKLTHRRSSRSKVDGLASTKLDLRSLFLGEPVAEHEADRLHEYFVDTSSYHQAMKGPLTILVGRRGTGKTAILYAIRSDMLKTTGHHVTVLKPIGYETHGLIRVLEEVRHRSERGFLIESLWKYLVYSEIASNVAATILGRPVYQVQSQEDKDFLTYYTSNSSIFSPPFSERIDSAVSSLEGLGEIVEARDQRLKISENLHTSRINELRRHLGNVLAETESLTLLIDGLDEPWGPGEHINHLSELIAGLLGLVQSIPNDFRRSSSKVKSIDTKITVSLRSDIFAFIQHLIPEQDKLPITRVTWSDPESLLRVLEERMLHGAPITRNAGEVWDELFPARVVGVTPQDFILRTALPRPRDIIHLVKAAVSIAINRRHEKVLPDDLLTARGQYSQYAFDSILKEDDPSKAKLETLLYEFAGLGRKLDKSRIESIFASAGIEKDDTEFYLDLLCDISFLGIETKDTPRYSRDEEERRTLRNIARVLANRDERSEEFEINPAFYQVLQIE